MTTKVCSDCFQRQSPLSHFNLHDNGASLIFKALLKNKTLTKLIIADNQIKGMALKDLESLLNINTTITHLDISQNPITPEYFNLLRNILQKNSSLEYLNVSACGDDVSVLKNISSSLKELKF